MECEFVDKIGSGQYGEVWQGICDDQVVAIKIFTNPDRRINKLDWRYEVDILKKLKAKCLPYALCLKSKYFKEGKGYIITNFIEGKTMYNKIKTEPLEERENDFSVVNDLVRGIDMIHQQGIAHQDVKGQNIMYDENENVFKYVDFGYGCLKDELSGCIKRGTEYTMPPNILTLKSTWEEVASQDLWSVGIMLLRWYTLVWDGDFYKDLNMKLYSRKYPLFPYYNKFPKDVLLKEIKKIKNYGVRAIVGMLLVDDWKQRNTNFAFVLKLLKNIEDISTKTEIDTIKIVDALITKIYTEQSSVGVDKIIPTVQRILELH